MNPPDVFTVGNIFWLLLVIAVALTALLARQK